MIYNLGSINADFIYDVPRLPRPGETMPALAMRTGLGGKGANMSVAVARAGAPVRHIGAVGEDGRWAKDALSALGVDTAHVVTVDAPTGHAIVMIDPAGENAIVIFPGANRAQSIAKIDAALRTASPDDILLVQNETDGQDHALRTAREKGLTTLYAAAPFDEDAVLQALPMTDILVLNEIEMQQLEQALEKGPAQLGVQSVVVTRGAKGARLWSELMGWSPVDIPSPKVDAIDTTGAGDTFTGYMVAALHSGMTIDQAVKQGVTAAALKVTRKGVADAIPSIEEVLSFLG